MLSTTHGNEGLTSQLMFGVPARITSRVLAFEASCSLYHRNGEPDGSGLAGVGLQCWKNPRTVKSALRRRDDEA